MQQHTTEVIEKVKELAGKYRFKVSEKTVGRSVGTFYRLRIENAEVEVKITGRRCIITVREGNPKQFEKPQSEEYQRGEWEQWVQKILDHTETLLK